MISPRVRGIVLQASCAVLVDLVGKDKAIGPGRQAIRPALNFPIERHSGGRAGRLLSVRNFAHLETFEIPGLHKRHTMGKAVPKALLAPPRDMAAKKIEKRWKD